MKFYALIADTIREIYSKKIIVGLIVIEAVVLVITSLVIFREGMQAEYAEAREIRRASETATGTNAAGAMQSRPGSDWQADSLALLVDTAALADTALTEGARSRIFGDTTSVIDPRSSAGNAEVSSALLEKVRGQLGAFPVFITLGVLFLGLFATAGIVPSMMEKGTVELLLSKPIGRPMLLLGRIVGGVAGICVNHALFVVALWALFGLASGVWLTSFLVWTILIPLFAFVVVYSGVIFLSILTESWVLPVSIAYIHLMVLSGFLYARESTIKQWVESDFVHVLVDGLYWSLPQVSDLSTMTMESVYASSIDSIAPIAQGIVFTATMLSLAAWRFSRRDF